MRTRFTLLRRLAAALTVAAAAPFALAAPAAATAGPGGIIIIKNIDGGKDDSFTFVGNLGAREGDTRSFTITTVDGSGTTAFREIDPGFYRVTEDLHPALLLVSIACDHDVLVDVENRTAAIELEPGQVIICVFTSSPPPL